MFNSGLLSAKSADEPSPRSGTWFSKGLGAALKLAVEPRRSPTGSTPPVFVPGTLHKMSQIGLKCCARIK